MNKVTLSDAKTAIRFGRNLAEEHVQILFSRDDVTPDDIADMMTFKVADVATEDTMPFIRRGVGRVLDKYEEQFEDSE